MRLAHRIAWLRDRISQMGHHPNLYYQWHEELEQLLKVQRSQPPTKTMPLGSYAARLKAHRMAKKQRKIHPNVNV
jgi:hypothetical protein